MAKDWYKWTVGEIEDNLNLLQAQAVDYLKEPFECDCFLKHTSVIRGYANEMQSFAKTPEEKGLLSRLAAWSDKWHKVFEGKKTVPKEVMQSLHDETREMRKGVEDRFFIKKAENLGASHTTAHGHGVYVTGLDTKEEVALIRSVIKKRMPSLSVTMARGTSWGWIDVGGSAPFHDYTPEERQAMLDLGLDPSAAPDMISPDDRRKVISRWAGEGLISESDLKHAAPVSHAAACKGPTCQVDTEAHKMRYIQ